MAELSEPERVLREQIEDQDLQTHVYYIRRAAEKIWSEDAPRIIKGYTHHGISHSQRVAAHVVSLLKANHGQPLSSEELYLLLAGIYLHDIGMQCDVVKYPEIKERAKRLGARFDVEFTASTADKYNIKEQKAIRENHHYLAGAWIHCSSSNPNEDAKLPLLVSEPIPRDLVDDLIDVCIHHSKILISRCPVDLRYLSGRLQLVAALLRFADELDVDAQRVTIETVKNFRLPPTNAAYWWLHRHTRVSFPKPNIVLLRVWLDPVDFEAVGSLVDSIWVEKFRRKNESVISALAYHDVNIIIDAESGVREHPRTERLPAEIVEVIRNMQEADNSSVVHTTATAPVAEHLHASASVDPNAPNPVDQARYIEREMETFRSLEGFVGRQDQLQQLDDWLSSPVPLASIVGPPAVGKTSLVREWCARKVREKTVQPVYVDPTTAFLPWSASIDDYSQFMLDRIALKLGQLNDEVEALPGALASRLRQSGLLVVLDQFEATLNREPTVQGLSVGQMAKAMRVFLESFMNLQGAGRIILVSNVEPANINDLVARGDVKAITGGSLDRFQLGGFTLDECLKFAERAKADGHEPISDGDLLDAFTRLGGHPKGLAFFLSLTQADRARFLSSNLQNELMDDQLTRLMMIATESCSEAESRLLLLLAHLRHPEVLGFFTDAAAVLGIDRPWEAIWDLQRRSLVEYGGQNPRGYSAHGIVKEFVRAQNRTRVLDTHHMLAGEYERRAKDAVKVGSLDLEYLRLLVETAYHYYQARNEEAAVHWRNEVTFISLQIGQEAHFAGSYQLAKDSATAFIDAVPALLHTPATARHWSNAYFYRASNQHKLGFDWRAEVSDIREALYLNADNDRALTFLIPLFYGAARARVPWCEVERELDNFSMLVREAGRDSNTMNTARATLVRLLCFQGTRTPDEEKKQEIVMELEALSGEAVALLSRGQIYLENTFIACCEMFSFLNLCSTEWEVASRYADQLSRCAELGVSRYPGSGRLWLKRIDAHRMSAQLAKPADERRQQLDQALSTLDEMQTRVAPPSGYARELSRLITSLTPLLPKEEALVRIQQTLRSLRALRRNLSTISITEDELDCAEIRLCLEAAYLTPKESEAYISQAVAPIRLNLESPNKWLSVEMADLAISILTGIAAERWTPVSEDEDMYSDDDSRSTLEVKNKKYLQKLKRKIEAAMETAPSRQWDRLSLAFDVEYLSKCWHTNSRNEPRQVQSALSAAEVILKGDSASYADLVMIADLYRVIATRTFKEETFEWAKQRGEEVTALLLHEPSFRGRGLYQKAKFLRSVLDYQGARRALREHLEREPLPIRRFYATHLFLDSVAHSIYPESIRNPEQDPSLRDDAMFADDLYREYRDHLDVKWENIDDIQCAARELMWLRCVAYLGSCSKEEDLSCSKVEDLSWLNKIYNELEFLWEDSFSARKAHLIGYLSEQQSRVAKILGAHWENEAVWREAGSMIANMVEQGKAQREHVLYLWEVSRAVSAPVLDDIRVQPWRSGPEKRASSLTKLNLVRAKLEYPVESNEWKEGREELAKWIQQGQSMSWIYWRFVKELKELHLPE